MPPERRRVILDEDINWKLSRELQKRGRADATAVRQEKIDGRKDGALFKALAAGFEPYVLVTYDNKMLRAHKAEIAHHNVTVAVVDEAAFLRSGAINPEAYQRDVVHRWLHLIEVQAAGTQRSYSLTGSRRPR